MKVTVIGAGNMGGALAHGWLKKGEIELTLADKNEELLNRFASLYPQHLQDGRLHVLKDNRQAIQKADVIILVVKPWLMQEILVEIKDDIDLSRQIIVSDAAGFDTRKIEQVLCQSGSYVYAIPNIAAEYAASMSFVAYNASVTADQRQAVSSLYGQCGAVMELNEEQVAAGMMMASCGIAYVMRMVRAMMLAGVEMGFYPQQAQQIAQQTMAGAVSVLQESGLHPEAAIDKVTTPKGVTIKGLNEMDMAGFNAAVIRALKAGLQ